MSSVPPGEVAPFIKKLRTIVDAGRAVSWSEDGTTFLVSNVAGFEREVLSKYFKSPHMASFVRQLNFYGFRKMTSRNRKDQVGPKTWEFQHANFLREDQAAAVEIRRRSAADTEAVRSEGETMRLSVASLRNQLAAAKKQLASARASLAASERAREAEAAGRAAAERELAALRARLNGGWAPSELAASEDAAQNEPSSAVPIMPDGDGRVAGSRKRLRMSSSAPLASPPAGRHVRIRIKPEAAEDAQDEELLVAPTPSAAAPAGGNDDASSFGSRRSPSSLLASALSGLRLGATGRPTLSAMAMTPGPYDRMGTAAPEMDALDEESSPFDSHLGQDDSPFGIPPAPLQPGRDGLPSGPLPSDAGTGASASSLGFGVPRQEPAAGLALTGTSLDDACPGLSLLPALSRVGSDASLGSTSTVGSHMRSASTPREPPALVRASSIDSVDTLGAGSVAFSSASSAPVGSQGFSFSSSSSSSSVLSEAGAPGATVPSSGFPTSAVEGVPAAMLNAIIPQIAYQANLGTRQATASALALTAMLAGQVAERNPSVDPELLRRFVAEALVRATRMPAVKAEPA